MSETKGNDDDMLVGVACGLSLKESVDGSLGSGIIGKGTECQRGGEIDNCGSVICSVGHCLNSCTEAAALVNCARHAIRARETIGVL